MYWTARGWGIGRGYPPPTVGNFLEIWVLNTGFGYIVKFELTSTLAPNVYDCTTRGGEGTILLLRTILDTKGRMWEGAFHGGIFF